MNISKQKSLQYLARSARLGHPEAMCLLALLPAKMTANRYTLSKQQFKRLKIAALCGSAEAQREVASLYGQGEVVAYDPVKARYWYSLSAERGYGESQHDIAGMYLRGEGGERDIDKAIYWYKQCASLSTNVPWAEFSANILSDIYRGDYESALTNESVADYWQQKAQHFANLPYRVHPEWFYDIPVRHSLWFYKSHTCYAQFFI